MSSISSVTVIIPCRDEGHYISQCLDSIVANDYPKERFEILVVDGMSKDRTRSMVESYVQRYPFIRLVPNPKRIFPSGVNVGVRHAKGEIIVIMNAHSTYTNDYISQCVRYLQETGADNVGGVLTTVPSSNTLIARSIAIALSHPFGTLTSHFRIGAKELKWVDTVAFGCYRKGIFERVGLFNEDLVRSSDMDFNVRLRRIGGKILLVPSIIAYYRPQFKLWRFWRHNFLDGVWAIYPLRFGSPIFSLRHLTPIILLFAFSGFVTLAILWPVLLWLPLSMLGGYALIALHASTRIAVQERKPSYVITLPLVFMVRHSGYGLGSIAGLLRVITSQFFWKSVLRSLLAK